MRHAGIGRSGYTLLAAATASRLSVNTTPVALALLIITRAHDARLAGLLIAAFTLPTLIAGPVLGAFLDRLRRRKVLFAASQAVLALDVAADLALAGHSPGWMLAVLAFVAGVTAPVLTGGYSSMVPLVIPTSMIGRANALDSASYGMAGIVGPGVVSALAGALGVTAGFAGLVTVAALGIPLLLAAPMPFPAGGPRGGPAAYPAESLAAAVADGLRLLRRSRELFAVTAATTAGQFFLGPLPVLLPLLALALGRPASGGGWLLTSFSLGGVLGALASDRLIACWTTRVVLVGSLAGLGAFLALLAALPHFWAALMVAPLAGMADGPALAATLTVRQGNVPHDRYAQVLATASSFKLAAFSAGSATAGLLTGLLTARELLFGLAVGQLISASPMLLVPRPAPSLPDEREPAPGTRSDDQISSTL